MLLVSEPSLGADEKAALSEVIDSNWITMGDRVRAFEQAFADMHGATDAVAVSSCTAALHLALDVFDIGPGDEVLVPSLSFVATANSAVYCRAKPVFVDIQSLDRPLMDPADAARKCSSRTRAVVVMHYGGMLCDPATWRDFAGRHGLLLIEDSAHAVGPERGEIYGDVAAFSFYGNKNITTGEGGMVISHDPAITERIRRKRGAGMTSGTYQRLGLRAGSYDVTTLGYNYRMTELNAAIGLKQLEKLPNWNRTRRHLMAEYSETIARLCPEVMLPVCNATQNPHIMAAVLPANVDRMAVMGGLRDDEVQTSMHYPPIHNLSWYCERYSNIRLPITEAFARRELTLPLHAKMTSADVEHVLVSLARHIGDQGETDDVAPH
jgi:dTDP-4-amino-4,6-dideoxygalactose transaminase